MAGSEPAHAPTPEVVYIDDSPEDRQLLDLTCRRAGLTIRWIHAGSCREARELLAELAAQESPVPLMILDQRLPDGLGTDLLPEVHAALPAARAIVFSTSNAPADRERIPADSDAHYLVKPYGIAGYDEIIGHIRAAVGAESGRG